MVFEAHFTQTGARESGSCGAVHRQAHGGRQHHRPGLGVRTETVISSKYPAVLREAQQSTVSRLDGHHSRTDTQGHTDPQSAVMAVYLRGRASLYAIYLNVRIKYDSMAGGSMRGRPATITLERRRGRGKNMPRLAVVCLDSCHAQEVAGDKPQTAEG